MSAITLDQLLALNEEIAALVRAGVPLEKNLGQMGGEMPGQLGKLAALISERAERGESLDQIIAEQSAQFPPVYRAVIEAGQRGAAAGGVGIAGGHGPPVGRNAPRGAGFGALSAVRADFDLPVLRVFYDEDCAALKMSFSGLNLPDQTFFRLLTFLGKYAPYWGSIVPGLLLLAAVWFWWSASKASWIDGRGVGRFFEKLPWIGAMIANSRNAAFTEMFATLLKHEVPMHEALVLAADSAGSSQLRHAVRQAAEELRAGRPLAASEGLTAFPPLLRWMIPAAAGRNLLLPALNRAAAMYRHRAEHLADTIRNYLPMLMVAIVAGGMTLCYALCLFAPYTTMLRTLAR